MCLNPTSQNLNLACLNPNPISQHLNLVCRALDAVAPLLLLLFSAGRVATAGPAAAAAAATGHTAPSKQQQQQKQAQQSEGLGLSNQDWVQLQAVCYGLLNQLIEVSCVGSEQQLLVLPLAVGELLQDRLAEGGVLTGEPGREGGGSGPGLLRERWH